MGDCCMGRRDARFEIGGTAPSMGVLRRLTCRLAKRFMAGCRAGLDARNWTGAWNAVAALAGGASVLSASATLPILAPGMSGQSAVAWAGSILLPFALAVGVAPLLPRALGHLDRRIALWLLSALLVAADIGTALAPTPMLFTAARLGFGLALGGFWSVIWSLDGRLTTRASSARARRLIAGAGLAGALPGAILLFWLSHMAEITIPGIGTQLAGDRVAYLGAALAGLAALAAEIKLLPHLPDNGVPARRRLAITPAQPAE